MPEPQVELEKRRNRALKALQIVLECGNDHEEGLATLDMARSAYGPFAGDYRPANRLFSQIRTWAAVAAIAALSIGTFEMGERAADIGANALSPPFVWGSARFVNDVVEEGGTLEIIASHKYLKACNWSVVRNWYEDHKLIATTLVDLPAITANPEFSTQKWPVPMPEGLKPGNYDYRAVLKADCAGSPHWQEEIFEQNFQVVPRRIEPPHHT